jgi:hypothetical protein
VSTLGLIIGKEKPTHNGAATIESAIEELLELRKQELTLNDKLLHIIRLAQACQGNCPVKSHIHQEKQVLMSYLREYKEKENQIQEVDRSENRAIIDDPFLVRI